MFNITSYAGRFFAFAYLVSNGGFFALYGASILDRINWLKPGNGQADQLFLGGNLVIIGTIGVIMGIAIAAKK